MSNIERFVIQDEDYKPIPASWKRTYQTEFGERLVTTLEELTKHLNQKFPNLDLDQAYWAFVDDVTPQEVAGMPFELRDELMDLGYVLPT